jgi:uncharacterized protein YjbI with pentapeptide repeats
MWRIAGSVLKRRQSERVGEGAAQDCHEHPRQSGGLSVTRVPQWTGFGKKTLWDWLQLLIVPAILIAVTLVWSATQTRSDNRREDRRIAADRAAAEEARQDATLQGYLDKMGGLMLDKKLLTSKPSDAVRKVARSVTLTTLRRLDRVRKAAVLRFLYESRLIDRGNDLVDLADADFRGADLRAFRLAGVDLAFANFAGANIDNANLYSAELRGLNLRGATLSNTLIRNANLSAADFAGANLSDVDFSFADLSAANFTSANLSGAELDYAKLNSANNLDLSRFITDLPTEGQKGFLDSQEKFLDSLSEQGLARFNLSPEKLARIRREASGG